MNYCDKKIQELTKILQGENVELLTYSGFLSEKTIKVAFEQDNKVFQKVFQFTNKKDYLRFNRHLRMVHGGY